MLWRLYCVADELAVWLYVDVVLFVIGVPLFSFVL